MLSKGALEIAERRTCPHNSYQVVRSVFKQSREPTRIQGEVVSQWRLSNG
jgi:hypothetical protein